LFITSYTEKKLGRIRALHLFRKFVVVAPLVLLREWHLSTRRGVIRRVSSLAYNSLTSLDTCWPIWAGG